MRASWITWIWSIFILLSTLAVALITFLFPEIGVIRPLVIMGFLFIIPGITVVRFFRLNGPTIEWMLAIALSFTIDASVAVIILYAGVWSPKNIMSFLIGFCFAGAIAQLLIVRPASAVVKSLPSDFEDVVTVDLAKSLPSDFEDTEVTIILNTKKQPAALLQPQPLFQDETQEKKVSLDKPELSGKEA